MVSAIARKNLTASSVHYLIDSLGTQELHCLPIPGQQGSARQFTFDRPTLVRWNLVIYLQFLLALEDSAMMAAKIIEEIPTRASVECRQVFFKRR